VTLLFVTVLPVSASAVMATGVVELVERCSGNKQEGAAQSLVSWLLERLIVQRAGSL